MAKSRPLLFMLIVALVACKDTGPTRQQTYEKLYRAGRAVEGAISVGVSYADLGTLVRELSTEVLIAGDLAKTETDKQMVAAYRDAMLTYKDSLTVWKGQIESAKYEWLEGQIPLDQEIAPIATKYDLPQRPVTPSFSRNSVIVIPNDALQTIWQAAAQNSDRAIRLYFAPADGESSGSGK